MFHWAHTSEALAGAVLQGWRMGAPGCQAPSGMAGWRKGVISRGKNHRLLLLLPWVSMGLVLELASMKEVHSPTHFDDEDDDPEDDDGDSPIFKLRVSISLDVMGRCVQLNWKKIIWFCYKAKTWTSLSSINFPILKYPELGLLSLCHNSTVTIIGISLRAYPTFWMFHLPNNKANKVPFQSHPCISCLLFPELLQN